jgi:twitching motility protein PilT
MGVIDPLLGIVQLKKASGLVLASDAVPTLLVGGVSAPLTMPPLSAGMLDDMIESVLGPEERAALGRGSTVDTTYSSELHGPFVVRAHTVGGKVTLTLSRGAAAAGLSDPAPPTAGGPGRELGGVLGPVLDQAIARGASDVLLSAGARPLIRVDGSLIELPGAACSGDDLLSACEPFLSPAHRRQLEVAGSVDFALERGSGDGERYRANLFRHARGLALALRPIWTEVPTLEDLHLPSGLADLTRPRSGLVLIAGATGAGKSTTLAALLDQVNRTRACHIVTLEDPVEYLYPRRRAMIHQREVGRHIDSFASGLRAALRENPDVILLGEMRDQETIRLALTAAETGHLVLSTLHSASAAMAIERIVDVFPEGEKELLRTQLASALRYVIAQQLLPGAQGGLVPALEVLTVTHAVAAQIREGRMHMLGAQMEIGAERGMVPMDRALADLVRAGYVTRAAALAAAPNPDAVERLLDDRPAPRR